jgi:8-oxo-dGTP pyrophosphatase MutT (NUDIX family)
VSALIAALRDVEFADGSVAHVDLVRDAEPASESAVFAAMAVVAADDGRYAVVYSPRRQEWSVPGGWREVGETVRACAVREVWEETGLRLDGGGLEPVGFERFAPVSLHGRWPDAGGLMQLVRVQVPGGDELVAALDDAVDPCWLTAGQFEERCGERFWWPLVAAAL